MANLGQNFRRGLVAGIPIALGYLSVSFTFGIIAVSYGMTWWEAVLISMTTVTSAGQFSGIQTMQIPGAYLTMIISQLTINVRYSFMSVSLSQKLDKKFSGIWRWLFGFMMTDEIFAVASSEKKVSRSFFAGLATLPYFGWALGTLFGAILGSILPAAVMSALGLAIYGMFVAIVVPEMKQNRSVIAAVAIAAGLSVAMSIIPVVKDIPAGIKISICAIVASLVMAFVSPVKDEDDETESAVSAEGGAA